MSFCGVRIGLFFFLSLLFPCSVILFSYSQYFSLTEVFHCRGSFLMRLLMYILGSFSVTFSVPFFVFLTAWFPYSSFGLCGLYGSVGML